MPPAPVRDLGVESQTPRTRRFFIPTHFHHGQRGRSPVQRFDVKWGVDANQSLIDPVKTALTSVHDDIPNSVAVPDDWVVIDAHEDWFLHSTPVPSPQTRVPLSGPYPYLYYMDVGSQGWRDFVVGKYAASLAANPTADGVFLDGVMLPTEYESLLGPAYPSYNAEAYQSAALEFIYAVKDAAPGKSLVVNSELSKAFTLAADGGSCEGFVHFGGQSNQEQITESQWLRHLSVIGDRDFDGRFLLVGSGSADSTLASAVEYRYASFLGYNEHARSSFYRHRTATAGIRG
jgi:hypothetical protein